MRFNPIRVSTTYYGKAYIAGEGLGIVSINGRAAAREILCLDNDTKAVLYKTWSHADGSYLIPGLDKDKLYVVIAFDYKGDYEPVAYDRIAPHIWQPENP